MNPLRALPGQQHLHRVKPPPGGSRLGPVAANPTCFTCKGGLERTAPRQSSLLLLPCCSIAPSARRRDGTEPGCVAEPPAPPAPLRTSPDSQTCSPNTILCFLLVMRLKITPRQSAPEALAAGSSPSHRRLGLGTGGSGSNKALPAPAMCCLVTGLKRQLTAEIQRGMSWNRDQKGGLQPRPARPF